MLISVSRLGKMYRSCWFLLICCTIGYATVQQPSFTSSSKPIVVNEKNAVFAITMQSNPTTGYSWQLQKIDKSLIRIMGHKYVAPTNKKQIGAPGYEVWVFEAKHHAFKTPQITEIKMKYARPWETKNASVSTFKVKIQ